MLFSLSQHLSQSWEMSKKMVPVYFGLLLKFLVYIVGLFLVSFLPFFVDLSAPVRIILFAAYLVFLVVVMVQGIRYEVSKIKGVEAVAQGKANVDVIWADSKGHFWKMILLGMVVFTTVIFGFLILIVPGIIFLVWYGFSHFAMFLRDKNTFGAMHHSKDVSKGYFWHILLRAFLMVVLASVLLSPAVHFENNMREQVEERIEAVLEGDVALKYAEMDLIEIMEARNAIMNDVYREIFSEMALPILAYTFYSFVMGFFLMCFGYSYWYLLFVELEKINNVK